MTDAGPPTPPPSLPPPSSPVDHPAASTIAHPRAPRKRWLIVLISVLVLVVGMAVAGTVLFATNTLPPLRTAYHFTNDIEDGDVSGAFANLCARLRGPSGRSEFDDFATAIRRDLDHFTVNPFGVGRNGNRATVDFTAFHDNGRHTNLELVVVDEAGDWRVCDVRFRG